MLQRNKSKVKYTQTKESLKQKIMKIIQLENFEIKSQTNKIGIQINKGRQKLQKISKTKSETFEYINKSDV